MSETSAPAEAPRLFHWPDGQVREEEPYPCGAFLAAHSHLQCALLSDHDGEHQFTPRGVQGGEATAPLDVQACVRVLAEFADDEKRYAFSNYDDSEAVVRSLVTELPKLVAELSTARAALEEGTRDEIALREIRAITEPLALMLSMGEPIDRAPFLAEIQRVNRIIGVARGGSGVETPP